MSAPIASELRSAYAQRLDRYWHDAHPDELPEDAPTVVSTFAGAGGSSLGYAMAGYRELCAVEWESHAAATFRHNFPGVPVVEGDIADWDPLTLGLAPGELDVFDGSPPCQGFSTTGKRAIDDPRNQLFREFVRCLTILQPKAFVMENVSGMTAPAYADLFREVLEELRGAGYRVKARLIDCSYLGIPQRRKRLVFIGARNDLGVEPVHPTPLPRSQLVTVRDAIADLRPDELGVLAPVPHTKAAVIAPMIPQGRDGSWVLQNKFEGKKQTMFNLKRLHWERPSNTIVKMFSRQRAGFLHPSKNRFLSTTELSRIQSFPDQYDWGTSKYQEIHARIGNSVPPLMMRAIALEIRREILGQSEGLPQ